MQLKRLDEGRPNRVIPLLVQAILEARRLARERGAQPLAVLHVTRAPQNLWLRMEAFRNVYGDDVAIGLLVDTSGYRFVGLDDIHEEFVPRGRRRGAAQLDRVPVADILQI